MNPLASKNFDIDIDDVVKVADDLYGKVLDVYTNGYMTTAGFVDKELAVKDNTVISVTYDSDHADCLPVNWADMLWIDDNDEVKKIKEIRWDLEDSGPVYVMSDNIRSETVTQ